MSCAYTVLCINQASSDWIRWGGVSGYAPRYVVTITWHCSDAVLYGVQSIWKVLRCSEVRETEVSLQLCLSMWAKKCMLTRNGILFIFM